MQLIKRLWHSPMFTAWGGRGAQSLRFLVLLPLVLNHFNEVEVSAWLLFGSIIFFSEMLSNQIMLVFSRMIALANGGATDLSPVRGRKVSNTLKEVNWPLLERLYSTSQAINAGWAVLGAGLTLCIGYCSLSLLLEGYGASDEVWNAFLVFVAATFVVDLFKKYQSFLRGMNHVALVNRWEILIYLLSPIAGACVLLLGGGILALALTMQFFLLLGVFVHRWLLLRIAQPQFRPFRMWAWDHQVIAWAWQPLWRGVIQMLANRGTARISAVALALYVDPATLAPILLAVRLLDVLETFSDSPISSHSPRFGRLLASGDVEKFRNGIERSFKISFLVHVVGVIAIALFAGAGLKIIGSDIEFLPINLFFSLAIAHTLMTTVRKSLMISIVGNHVVAIERFAIAVPFAALLAFSLTKLEPFTGFIASAYLPVVLIANIKPLSVGCVSMQTSALSFVQRTMMLPLGGLLAASILSLALPLDEWSLSAVRALSNW